MGFPLNDDMYVWRADAQRFLDKRETDHGWPVTFAARVVWLVNELERVVASRTALSEGGE